VSVQQSIPNEQANENAPVADESLDDATIEEGDEHRRQIRALLWLYSMMCVQVQVQEKSLCSTS
jgi:hypothetical protein